MAELPLDLWRRVATRLVARSDLNALLRSCRALNALKADERVYAEWLFRCSGKWQALDKLITQGLAPGLRYLLDQGLVTNQDLTSEGKEGSTWLHDLCSCWSGDQTLRRAGDDAGQEEGEGEVVLGRVCRQGHLEVARILLDAGCDVNARETRGYTPLWLACSQGCTPLVELLLGVQGVDLEAPGGETTPLCAAAEGGHHEVVRLLVAAGCDVNVRVGYLMCPALWLAARAGHAQVVQVLLAAPGIEADLANEEDMTPLHIACMMGREEVVVMLLAGGCDVNAVEDTGCTPLLLACQEGTLGIVEELLGVPGVDFEARDENGMTAVEWAAQDRRLLAMVVEAMERVQVGSGMRRIWPGLLRF